MDELPAVEIDHETGSVELIPHDRNSKRYRAKLDTISDIKREMGRVYRECRSGLLDAQAATKQTWILQAIGKIIADSELEQRVEALESKHGA